MTSTSRRERLQELVAIAKAEKAMLTKTLDLAKRALRNSEKPAPGRSYFRQRVMLNLMWHLEPWGKRQQAAATILWRRTHRANRLDSGPLSAEHTQTLFAASKVVDAANDIRGKGPDHTWMFKAARLLAEAAVCICVRSETDKGLSVDRCKVVDWMRREWPAAARGDRMHGLIMHMRCWKHRARHQFRRFRSLWNITFSKMGRAVYMDPAVLRRKVSERNGPIFGRVSGQFLDEFWVPKTGSFSDPKTGSH